MASAPTCGPQTFLDHGRSAHVDRWDGERAITVEQRNLDFLNALVNRICKVLVGAEKFALEMFSKLKDPRYRSLPEELIFLHAEEILEMYPELPRKQRETAVLQKNPALSIVGIGWPLKGGYRTRCAQPTTIGSPTPAKKPALPAQGLNGDILVWNPVTKRRHELTSMGVRVTKETLRQQLELSKQFDFRQLPYHRAILEDRIPLFDRRRHRTVAHANALAAEACLGEVSVTGVAKILKEICAKKDSFVLE
ncbi:MAG TPA: hypothetical protein VNY29_00735 [Terriglobales bacterium]|nr:hypothetical protein [Terriglobales bacterium]